jgi:hypothetical protein
VHATDAGSGVGTVSTYRPAVAGAVEAGAPVQLHLVSGNRHDGVWGARLRVPRCAMSPGHNAANYVTVTDRSGLYATTTPIGPRLIGPDHRPPGLQGGTSAGIVGLDFYEAVHGISRSTVAVYARSPSGEAVRQQGSWTCTGRREHIVSCRTGAVRHATFRYDGPPGSAVDLEPEGHLDVIDGHGNPQLALISVED